MGGRRGDITGRRYHGPALSRAGVVIGQAGDITGGSGDITAGIFSLFYDVTGRVSCRRTVALYRVGSEVSGGSKLKWLFILVSLSHSWLE